MDVIGYTADADTWCEDCIEKNYPGSTADDSTVEDSEGNEIRPMFDDDESDHPDHCHDCGVFLENALTSEGYRYVVDILADTHVAWPKDRRANLEAYWDRYSDYFDVDDNKHILDRWARRVFQQIESDGSE